MDHIPGNSKNRRQYYRLGSSMVVLRTFLDCDNDLKRDGVIAQNVSAGGILFFNSESLPVGCVSELEIYLPDGQKPVVALARVVRVEELENGGAGLSYEVGVEFIHLPEAEQSRLHQFCVEE